MMRSRRRRHLRISLLALCVAASLGASTAPADESPGTQAVREKNSSEAATGSARLETILDPPGEVVSLPRSVKLIVAAGAQATPKYTSRLPVGPKGANVDVQTVIVDGGRVDALVPKTNIPRGVLLQAPDKILGISTGGHLAVLVTEKAVTVVAAEGDVLVGQEAKFKPLLQGKMRVFYRQTGVSEDLPLPPPPTLKAAKPLVVALAGGAAVPLLSKEPGPLLVGIADDTGKPVGGPRRFDANAPIELRVPRAGVYRVVARKIGPHEVEGAISEPVRIQVLGLAPGQSPPSRGVFLLDRGERVHLAGTEGLEVRYGISPTYLPAASSIGLPQNRATSVEFRHPDVPDETITFRLAPRVMKAEIDLGPAGAKWPGAPIQMRVGLWDGAGRLMNPGDDMDVLVTVNAQEVPVKWQQTGRGLRADLDKQAGAGPWVVRVNVSDKNGKTIARDFLEVATK